MKSSNVYKGIIKETLFDELDISLTPEIERACGLINGGYETLLYNISSNLYQCLINGNIYGKERVNLDSLVPFNRMVNCNKYITEKKAVDLYNSFLQRELSTRLLYVGKVIYLDSYDNLENPMVENSIIYHGTLNDIKFKFIPVKKALLYKLDNNTFLDLEDYNKYNIKDISLGKLAVIDCRPFIMDTINNGSVEQGKVLKKFRKNSY